MRSLQSRIAVAAAIAGTVVPVGATVGQDLVVVPVNGRMRVFEVADAKAKTAVAARLDMRVVRAGNGRIAVPDPANARIADRLGDAWTLSGRVLVRASDRQQVSKAAGLGLARVTPLSVAKGWYAIDAGSIESAATLAERLGGDPAIGTVELDATPPIELRSVPNDTLFGDQWHLSNAFTPGVDVRAPEAWALGYTGQGVVIGIIESNGFLTSHEDLAPNFDAFLSQSTSFTSDHMTQVAGVAAGAGNNGMGIAGTAYNATLAQRLIGSNSATASALSVLGNDIHIKNNSWGPSDDGRFDFPSPVVMDAIESAAVNGREGLGTIIVWAGGNGAGAEDRVDYDPYASSRYTIAVGAIADNNRRSSYSEPGASLLIGAYSNGGSRGITTTRASGGYTSSFGGTSAASPLAAGVVALMLDANPDLSWRDVQHILVETARVVDAGNESWVLNGAGRLVNEEYGYGLIDAFEAVSLAAAWEPVGPEVSATSGRVEINEALPDGNAIGVSRSFVVDGSVRIESVELILDVESTFLGELDISIVSPDGTVSVFSRERFDSTDDFNGDVFTSMRHWGERSDGVWTVRMADRRAGLAAVWEAAELRVHGTDAGAPPCSPADLAEPFGVLDLADIVAFTTAYQAQAPDGDFAPPTGVFDEADLTAFVQSFFAGCSSDD